MDEILYRALTTYFKTLTKTGYKGYDIVEKLLVIDFIHDIFNSEWKVYVRDEEIKLMENLLYQFLGSTCEFSFPSNCICCCGSGSVNPEPTETSITEFSMVPSITSYTGSTRVTFTGATYKLVKGNNFKEDSLEITVNGEQLISDLPTSNLTEIAFSVDKNLTQGNTYTFVASVEDIDGTKHYSNSFTIIVKEPAIPVEPKYMFTGLKQVSPPTESEILQGVSYDYNNVKQFHTEKWVWVNDELDIDTVLWIALPETVTLVSIENTGFAGDFLYGGPNNWNYMETSQVMVNGTPYTVWYKINKVPTNAIYNVVVQ